jgi:hypothetical protein
MQITQILNNPHFCNLVAIIRVPLHSYEWRDENPEVRFSVRIHSIESWMTREHFQSESDKFEFMQRFISLLKDIMKADDRLRYTRADIQWLTEALVQEQALVFMSMLFASAYAEDQYLTPPEIAAKTGTSESNWRNKAAAGEFPGATKRGKVWLIPLSVLQSRGIITENLTSIEEDEIEESPAETD